jgi:hypothetical protein
MSETKILGKDAEFVTKEGEVASGSTIYPGMVLEETGTVSGGAGAATPTVQPVSSIEKIGESFRVALVPDTPPHANDSDVPIEHEYDAGEHVEYAVVQPGSRVQNALLADGGVLASSSDANVSYDNALGTNDDGTLQITTAAGSVLARAREAQDNSTGGGGAAGVDAQRIDVEVV